MAIQNPIIKGFHPDPSICRVGDDYYIVNSTFEWVPGVPIHHSRDLKNWKCIGHILTRRSQLDLRGVVDSAGVWAPSLSYADGKFWLVYTNLRNTGFGRPFKDIKIYLTTATDILGPWEDPIELDSIGFDPSFFHDDDGRKYLLNMEWDFRKGHYRFAGIVIQEFDVATSTLVGPRTKILQKKEILCEGPNMYKHDGWYYLLLAEGGTGWNHGISMARSRNRLGPYELDPNEAVVTTRHDDDWPLQKAGHGEIVETPAGEVFLVHLASRPIGNRCCTLGRETVLQRIEWRDGWLRLSHGDVRPQLEIEEPRGLMECPWPALASRDDFDGLQLDVTWSSLRVPIDESWLSLAARPGWLRVLGRDSLHSFFDQSLVAKRLVTCQATAETCLDFRPDHFTQMAGLICHYNTRNHFYLRITYHEEHGRILGIVLTDNGVYDEIEDSQLAINDWNLIYLRSVIDKDKLQFSASPDTVAWQNVGPVLDMSKLSDDYAQGFTGAMIGLCAQDLSGNRMPADFDYFELRDGGTVP